MAVSGASKPTLAPAGHLQKFAHDATAGKPTTVIASGSGPTTTTTNNDSNNSGGLSANRASATMLVPQILPCRADIAISTKRVTKMEKREDKNEHGRSNKARKLVSDNDEDGYVSLPV